MTQAVPNSPAPKPPAPDTFPRQYARTRRFSLGEPRSFRISTDEERVLFLRSGGGSDPMQKLWILERAGKTWNERLLVDPVTILGAGDDENLPAAERARRERLREQASGITAYDVDADATFAVFAMSGALYLVDVASGDVRSLATPPGAFDPRIAPDASRVAFVADDALHTIATAAGATSEPLISDPSDHVTWGVADFIASEELDRYRGFWWSPESTHILASRVDNSPVNVWWIADPSNPSAAPREHRYPAAGTANAIVSLSAVNVASKSAVAVEWTRSANWSHEDWPYLVQASWTSSGCTAVLMNRAQTVQRIVDINPTTGSLRTLQEASDQTWVELIPGTPARLAGDRLVTTICAHIENRSTADPEQTCALAVHDSNGTLQTLTPPNLQVRRVIHVDESRAIVAVTASRPLASTFDHLGIEADVGAVHLVEVKLDGSGITLVAGGPDVGMHDAAATGDHLAVIRSASTNRTRAELRVTRNGATEAMVKSFAEVALVHPKPIFFRVGPRAIPCALFLPSDHNANDALTKIPVLLDPYGGPHAQRVVQARNPHTTSQWFADQGFAVLVIDNRGTPGPGPLYEKAAHHDFTKCVLDDQVAGLHEAAARFPQLDLSRVAIRGWSFGGFLSAMAVLERPDVFHTAVVGAPVTEWRLYDTGYTERYLGHPDQNPDVYDANSVLTKAHQATRPMMLIHGLADDNVVCAHTLQLSSLLLAHGKPHEVLPLSNVTHMTPQEEVAENLLKLQVEFIRRSLPQPAAS